MYIPIKSLIKNYNLDIKGVIHVGACRGEEIFSYFKSKIKNIILIEANTELIKKLNFKIFFYNKFFRTNISVESFAAINDSKIKSVELNIANNTESSSILEFGKHAKLYPEIKYEKKIKVKSKTLNEIFENKYSLKNYNFINLDIQGAELLALRGADKILDKIDAIYTEVNLDEIYMNCARIEQIDAYLNEFGFKRALTKLPESDLWGDALYLKKDI